MPNASTCKAGCVLAEDTWGEIAEQLSVFDVFSLSQACKELYCFLSRRDLWIRILRSVCRRHGVFLPTYPAREAEMTLAQIQWAASRPQRWHELIRRKASHFSPWDISASKRLDEHPAITPSREGAFLPLRHSRVHLVPGGRFLVGLTLPHLSTEEAADSAAIALSIWDLGVPGSTDHHIPSIMASQSFEITSTVGVAFLSQTDVVVVSDSLFRVVIVYLNDPAEGLSWTALAFDMKFNAQDHSAPSLQRRGESIIIDTLETPGRLSVGLRMCLQGNRVLLQFSHSVVIWNVETMKYVCLKVPNWGTTGRLEVHRLAVLTTHHLVCIGVERMGAWRLSTLDWMDGEPLTHMAEASSQSIPPDMVISNPWNHKSWDRLQFTHIPIPGITENRVYFNVDYRMKGSCSTARYQLDVTPHPSFSPNGLPMADQEPNLTLTLIFATQFSVPRSHTHVGLAHGQVRCQWRGPRGASSYAYVPSDRPNITSMTLEKIQEQSALTQYVRLEADDVPKTFCALSGRMICIQSPLDQIQESVKVIDYLS